MDDPEAQENDPSFKRILDLYRGITKGDDKILVLSDLYGNTKASTNIWADGLAIPQSILQEGNLLHFGKLVYASHNGLSEEYEVSCSELDTLIEIAKESNHVIGARMMGGGFGGCTINFVDKSHTDDFCKSIVQEYKKRTGIDAEYHIVKISNGTGKSKV